MDFALICKEALQLAHKVIQDMGGRGYSEVHEAHVVDISTEADMAVSHALKDFFVQKKIPAILWDEESGKTELMPNPQFTIVFDDIDGTKNYHHGKGVLPYCSIVCIFDASEPKFADALAAGILEHVTGTIWIAERGKGCYVNGKKASISGKKILDSTTFIAIDPHTSRGENAKFLDIYDHYWLRDYGCAGLHLAGLSSGIFDAYICGHNKGHELGAGYLLVKEAGGVITDWKGNSLDIVKYDFNSRYQLIAAASPELCNKLRVLIK
jgi:myo-inositol-1(or 4)-monophosphatase